MNKKDMFFGISAGLLIGLLALPVLHTAKPALYAQYWWAIVPLFLIATPLGLYITYLIGKKISVVWQIGKFGVIGVLNTLVDWGVLAVLFAVGPRWFGVQTEQVLVTVGATITVYTIYKAISFIIANINSYYWNKSWTFARSLAQKTKAEFLQFFAVSLIGFLLNVGIASYVFKAIAPMGNMNVDQWGLVGAAIGSIVGLAWNFLGYKFIVFKETIVA
ncbi:hypothetical protein A2524_01940 [Candidatus Wolfebacteria bacterium RIFOXYD12_FULL_48_21]|uniref:GtrA/DPMS transmembrane domain-containing protein n=1 Tax=Candidatus Wolfebacteria bacterium RIFOXYD1_FULL_48_65 TaxID=1802561 RepID=A0A1F8DZP2_9BACT|nr:MAG: hypothetical protein A2610_03915 [Candidatus Wolfebacteria bacterium RIFOXYD1_FULL_48_65]OGM94556.1 MAG: hypothetical protein A2524_01940 [Candidatus Wolfebacteria bacterium RIFOXYD12_FULL_48_21]